jgi:hypothetical protein
MSSKYIIYHVVLLASLLCSCSLCSCRRNPEGIVEDSNNFSLSIPCWEQIWQCGNWKPLESNLNGEWVFYEGNWGMSICDNCGSIRILDFGNKKERTLFSPTSRFRPSEYEWTAGLSQRQLALYGFDPIFGEHKWVAGLSQRSFDLIEAGDILVVQQRNYLFIFMIQEISGIALDDQEVRYKVAKFSLKDKWPVKIDLSKVNWKERKNHKALPIAGRGIEFDLFPTVWTNDKPTFIEIFYDQYYGGSDGPEAVMGDDVAKIAIIHKDDVQGDYIVDLRRYRFKSWEDGLGNKRE